MASFKSLRLGVSAARILTSRMASSSTQVGQYSRTGGVDIANFDPNNYDVPVRATGMDDMMEPYGSWKQAYQAEIKRGNRALIVGTLSLFASFVVLFTSDALDGLAMPNLDNIMEDTEPFNYDTEGRVSVTRD